MCMSLTKRGFEKSPNLTVVAIHRLYFALIRKKVGLLTPWY